MEDYGIEYIGVEPAPGGVVFFLVMSKGVGGEIVETAEDSFTISLQHALELQEELAAAIAQQLGWRAQMTEPAPSGN